ncbi:MAG: DinB family protein, partial [Balneolaceae bacterium]|nr:DinB family protein [Balneolaceae bacterium]
MKYTYDWFIQQFWETEKQANRLASNNSEEIFLRRPAPQRWSAAECLDHLVEFGNIYFDTINRGLERTAIDSVS